MNQHQRFVCLTILTLLGLACNKDTLDPVPEAAPNFIAEARIFYEKTGSAKSEDQPQTRSVEPEKMQPQ